ncbi:uncharacterized protein C8R40DRAFT_1045041 [Lentinula edodes]|uniref:uncharacterized protein n=1 Tax=Lentinula edodes TaxID=5353 RepID=UPI001E8ED560|nr:uncharacterized protein C8R40DRAFT_1045041 [Lentinula edodes]KAH7875394.1 hypothetical protein C8R40DRAFT_1045041 [Lentinula edodes]
MSNHGLGSSSGSFAPYRNALKALSARTGTPLSSLVLSFGVLHELTAIVPLVGVFYGARAFGIGERIVAVVIAEGEEPIAPESSSYTGWARQKCRQWVHEGEGWAERVGRRYGLFGFENRNQSSTARTVSEETTKNIPGRIAGDVANAVVAYGATKAMLPLRIGLSLYLAPGFSRRLIEPLRSGFVGLFKR